MEPFSRCFRKHKEAPSVGHIQLTRKHTINSSTASQSTSNSALSSRRKLLQPASPVPSPQTNLKLLTPITMDPSPTMKSKLELRLSLSPKTTPSPKTNGRGSKKLEPKLTPRPQAKLTMENSTSSPTPSPSTSDSAPKPQKKSKKKPPKLSLITTSITQDQRPPEDQPISRGSTNPTTTSPLTGFLTVDHNGGIL